MSPEKNFPVEGEEFGPWMFVSGKGKTRVPINEGRRFQQGVVQSYSRPNRSMGFTHRMSRFSALADCDEEEEIPDGTETFNAPDGSSFLRNNGQMKIFDAGEREFQKREINHADRSKAMINQRKSQAVKGKENAHGCAVPCLEIRESNGINNVGRELKTKTVSFKKGQSSRPIRSHMVVSGSMEKLITTKLNDSDAIIKGMRSVLKEIGNVTMGKEETANLETEEQEDREAQMIIQNDSMVQYERNKSEGHESNQTSSKGSATLKKNSKQGVPPYK